jgi:hypothetical protein
VFVDDPYRQKLMDLLDEFEHVQAIDVWDQYEHLSEQARVTLLNLPRISGEKPK